MADLDEMSKKTGKLYDKDVWASVMEPAVIACRLSRFHAQIVEAISSEDKAAARKDCLKAVKNAAPQLKPTDLKFASIRRAADNVLKFRQA